MAAIKFYAFSILLCDLNMIILYLCWMMFNDKYTVMKRFDDKIQIIWTISS